MNKQLRDEWVKALRGGRYRQGQTRLFNPATQCYCCLGVLCEVAGLKRYQNARTLDGSVRLRALRNSLALGSSQRGKQKELINLNDNKNASFKKIANWISKNMGAKP